MADTSYARLLSTSDQAWTAVGRFKDDLTRIVESMVVKESKDQELVRAALYVVIGEIELRTELPKDTVPND